jgi:hypothetical protein
MKYRQNNLRKRIMMKRMIGTMMLLLVSLVSVPAHALTEEQCFDNLVGDYYISFSLTSFSGKEIDDGYGSFTFSDTGRSFDLCGFLNPDRTSTTDSFAGEVYDHVNSIVFLKSWGTIIWNSKGTNAYLQGGFDNDITSSYIDGTMRCSKGKCTLSAKGGINNYSSFIVSYTSIKGSGFFVWY